jgi:aspartate aminotransferase-like enzyme/GNAT superfamily N-acetyltransferase
MSLLVKVADQVDEFERIARLNYATFVEEIPQHTGNIDRRLVDKFHRENIYFICKDKAEIIGMVALRNQRPFSLDGKLDNLDAFLAPGESLCEIRLLAIEPSRRHGRVFALLMREVFAYCADQGFDRGLISGRLENIPLYEKLGFLAFGPQVGKPGAMYQPMSITRDSVNRQLKLIPDTLRRADPASVPQHFFLPGPVGLQEPVRQALQTPAYSHRSERYLAQLQKAKRLLLGMTKAQAVEVFLGTGTLANDVVAAHIAELGGEGILLCNGEFGERLVKHAEAHRLNAHVLRSPWGQATSLDALEKALQAHANIRWLWSVHCETSTGHVQPMDAIQSLCDQYGVQTHWDAISSLGAIPCDFSRARMVSSVSGKAIGALTGMAMVFYPTKALLEIALPKPRYFDLRYYADQDGIPFSGSSMALEALVAALQASKARQYAQRNELGAWLMERIAESPLKLIAGAENRAPGIFTLQLPESVSSFDLGCRLEKAGLLCNYAGAYLVKRNWLQICMLGEVSFEGLQALWSQIETEVLDALPARTLSDPPTSAMPFTETRLSG